MKELKLIILASILIVILMIQVAHTDRLWAWVERYAILISLGISFLFFAIVLIKLKLSRY